MSANLETPLAPQGPDMHELEHHIARELGVIGADELLAFEVDGANVLVALEVAGGLRAVLEPGAVASAVFGATELAARKASWVVLLEAGSLPRAASGAPDRAACEQRWRQGKLPAFASYHHGRRVDELARHGDGAPSQTEPESSDAIDAELAAIWNEVLGGGEQAAGASFFALGGNSVDAARLIARVQERLGVSLDPGAFFEAPRLRALTLTLRRLKAEAAHASQEAIRALARSAPLPLSAAQRRMRFLWQLDPASAAYNICGALRLRGVLDRAALSSTFDALARRHESLRTHFPEEAGEAVQRIEPAARVEIRHDDLSAHPTRERESLARGVLASEAGTAFDLERGPLWRVRLVRLAPEEHVLAVTLHHAIADGASMDVLVSEFARVYAASSRGQAAELPALPIQYADYAHWQEQRLASGEAERQLAYWTRALAGEPAPLELPGDRPRPSAPSHRGGRVELELEPALVERLRAVAREHDASVFMVLLGAFHVLLHRVTGQRSIRVGTPVANRLRFEAERVLGAFVNTQALQVELSERESFSTLLAQVRRVVVGAQSHQDLPFEKLVEVLQPERSSAHHPLFQVMFNHQQRDLAVLRELPGLEASLVPVHSPVTRFDLSLNTEEDAHGRIQVALVYATDRFEPARMERLGRHFVQGLAGLLAEPGRAIAVAPWLAPDELAELQAWSVPAPFTPPSGSVLGWIEARAAERPAATALVFGERELTYGELLRRAEVVARELVARGAGPDGVVGLLCERSLELVVGLLAILKTGAAFLPLDPDYPATRLEHLLDDSRVSLVLTTGASRAQLPTHRDLVGVELDMSAPENRPGPEGHDADAIRAAVGRQPHPDSLAYVLYTSGSTGQPKPVGNTHGAMAERLAWMQHEYRFSASETLLHKTPLGFDVAVWELLVPLIAGARLVIAAPGEHKDPRELGRLIARHEVSTIHFVPSLLREFVGDEASLGCTSLKRVFSGGEALTPELRQAVLERFPGARFDNRYGPTEALINASYWTCRPGDVGPVPIGSAIPNGALRIVDSSMSALPVGVAGELVIAGRCLARGYLGRPSLTAERFVPDPFGGPGERLYRTGDEARFRSDGAIEFLGRKDEQVKIRGVRVELGEVEAALLAQAGVLAAAALALPGPGGSVQLVAYVVAAAAISSETLESELVRRLPAQLVPALFVRLDALPRLPSGKLDRKALPSPTWRQRTYRAPAGDVQTRVARIWQEVLELSRLGASDDFFALGGHSLLATRVVSRVRREFDIELPLRDLFEARDLEAFAERVERAIATGRRGREPALELVDRGQPLPLSYSQERMWFLWSLEPESAAYNVGGSVRLRGPLNVAALEAGLVELSARHEALRTTFPRLQGVPVQRIHARGSVALEHQDLSDIPPLERDAELAMRAQAEAHRPFDLENGPLFRVTLYRLASERHVLVVTLHHVIAEGWAMDVFAREYVALYEAFCQGLPSALPPLAVQYADYAVWQRKWLESGERARQLEYWRVTLGDEHPVLELPADRPRPSSQSSRGDYHRFRLEPALVARLHEFLVEHGVTLSMTLTAALMALLHRYTGQTQLRIGYPIANRVRPEFEGLIGAFLNTQVLACDVHGELSAPELIQRVKSASIDAQSHQDLPFHHIVEALAPERSAAHTPLFQVMCNVQSWQFQQRRSVAGLELEFVENDARAAQFDLTLDASEVDGGIECAFSYSLDRFEPASIARMASHWVRLLDGMLEGSATPLARLGLLDPAELGQSLRCSRGPELLLESCCLHELFERQVARTPSAIALIAGNQSWTYAELEARANQLARALHARGVRPDERVGLCVERSPEAVLGLLAILKAGGAYLPLDPEYPAQRLRHMLRDSGSRLLLVQRDVHCSGEAWPDVEVWSLDIDAAELRRYPTTPLALRSHPEQLAYCIYTSGSTGEPKGVASSHRGLVNRLRWMQAELALGADDRVLGKTSLNFDVSVGELSWPLVSGACLVLAPPGAERDPGELGRIIRQHGVSAVDFVPALLQAFVSAGELAACPSLRLISVGGEALPRELERAVVAHAGPRLYNMYGPTEASIDVAFWQGRHDDERSWVPIGRPMANVELHVLDAELQPVPPLVTGELYIGGAALARGYIGRPAETARRFVPHPFAARAGDPAGDAKGGARLYRTGDRVRRRADGLLEFVGRVDAQVKLRGYRIELGEIEARLLEHPAVREAVVCKHSGPSGARLVAYVAAGDMTGEAITGADGARPEPNAFSRELRAHLERVLPEYMVPAAFVALGQLPRLSNGKLDAKSLPAPEFLGAERHTAPETDAERQLAAIWREVLGLERVGTEDNFFELGGDSIVVLQVVHRAREQGLALAPRHLFQHQTVRALAAAIPALPAAAAVEGPITGLVPLTPIQQRFFSEPMPERAHYNQALLLEPRTPLSPALLAETLSRLVQHHDALRLRYRQDAQGAWEQRYAEVSPEADAPWLRAAADSAELERLCAEAQRSLDLYRGPLHRALLITLPEGAQRLLVVVHHLVVDGVSWRVLLEDLQTLYRQLTAGQAPSLPPKTSSLQRWSETLRELAVSPEQDAERAYWLALAERPAPRELPRDEAQGGLLVRQRATQSFQLGVDRTAQLLRAAPEAYRTQVNDLLLTALARVLCRFSADTASWIELESHGRQDCFEGVDLSRSVGWFTSAFPVRLAPELGSDAASLASAIRSVKEELRGVPRGGLGHGVYACLGASEVRARLERGPRARVTFNYLGQFDQSFGPDALLSLAAEGSGPSQSEQAPLGNWLSVHGQVAGGQLALSIGYSREMYRTETIAALCAAYRRELELIVEHCTSGEAGGVSPSDFPLVEISQRELDALPVTARQIADLYPLTALQQGLLFHAAYSPGEDLYVCQLSADVDGLDRPRFERAWQSVVDRHDILRTSFHELAQGRGFVQLVHRSARVVVRELEAREPALSDAALERLAGEERAAGFALEQPPLMRLLLVRLGPQKWRFIWTHHHVLMDGWSSARLLEEVLRLYSGERFVAPVRPFRDFVAWLATRDVASDERFWKERLAELDEPTSLGSSLPPRRPSSDPNTGRGEHTRLIAPDRARELSSFARQERVTLNTLVQAAWLLLLQRYTGQRSVAFGATLSGRPATLPGAESMLGLFINTVPVIASPDPSARVGAWLRELQAENVKLREHEHSPLHDIQRWAGRSGQALFDTLVVFENYPLDQALRDGGRSGLRFEHVASVDLTNYTLSLMVQAGQQLRLKWDYARAALGPEQVAAIGEQLEQLALALARAPEGQLGALSWSTPAEHARLSSFNATERERSGPGLVHRSVERQSVLTPDAIAAVCGDQALTYSALDARANRLAHWLQSVGVGPDVLVGVCVERSLDLLVVLLGILKAGGAYVPLDPEYPLERLSYMMEDSGIELLITERQLLAGRPTPALRVWCIDEERSLTERFPSSAPASAVAPENLAYCIYTSGSTGQPKGVEVSHGSLENFLASMRAEPGVTARDRVLALTSLSFDISALEIYLPWCAGGTVVLVDRDTARDPRALEQVIERQAVTLIQATPSTWRLLVESGATDRLSGRRALCGGEALPIDLAQRLINWSPELWNVYGPTETTVWSSLQRIERGDPQPLLGRPLANTALHVLGVTFDAVPPDAPGELFIAGEGLARGYHARPSLTAERFLPDPFARRPGARLYRTGDLVRRRPDGSVEYLGRLDHQVKIRGHRIELGEIEARLLEHAEVGQAVVVAQPGARGPELVAYVVARAPALSDVERQSLGARLMRELRARLPAHMLPELMLLGELPLTQNGKIDRRALPLPGRATAEYIAPHTELGDQLARIWQEVLDVERVGLGDNFFSLGGHSLLATRVVSRIHSELSMDVPLRTLFETQSLADFERAVHSSSRVLDGDDLRFVSELLAQEESK
jgi:amino acid adenylation domain-containing protein/non-ribosomal peptide synthase protein (TIGR01720 family)